MNSVDSQEMKRFTKREMEKFNVCVTTRRIIFGVRDEGGSIKKRIGSEQLELFELLNMKKDLESAVRENESAFVVEYDE